MARQPIVEVDEHPHYCPKRATLGVEWKTLQWWCVAAETPVLNRFRMVPVVVAQRKLY